MFCKAQCITTFPYTQSFESGTSFWTSGGVSNDWVWGTPNKAFITTAGAGTKCWVTGTLSGSSYALGERSYVQSPCFNLSSLAYPYVSFKIYWESENIYDGCTFQSSIDNGVTWQNVGAFGDPVNCLNDNWFNQSNINNLTTLANPKHGWAGSQLPTIGSCQGGNGSNGWVTAKHCLSNLIGQTNVIFRFAFGAGTNCNGFDGVAFDDIYIGNAPANNASFTYNCTGNNLEYQFNNTSGMCPNLNLWNFGDPGSGVSNTGSFVNPTHTFSAPGTYVVTLTTSGPCNASSTVTQTIVTVQQTINTVLPCFGSINGGINVQALSGAGNYVYTINPPNTSNTTGSFTNLSANTYTVTTTDNNNCVVNSITTLSTLTPLNITTLLTNPTCNSNSNGIINVSTTGGVGLPYSYVLIPINSTNTTGFFNNLNGNNYTITVSDVNGCSTSTSVNITAPNPLTWNTIIKNNITCNGLNNGSVSITANGGTGLKTYTLQPTFQSNSTGSFSNIGVGNYTINVADANGCSISTFFSITEPLPLNINSINKTDPTCINEQGGSILVNASGGTVPYTYTNGSTSQSSTTFSALSSNTYTIIVTDANACSSSSIVVLNPIFKPTINAVVKNDLNCFNDNSGSLQVNAISNTTISSYDINPANATNSTGSFINLAANTYTILVTDANGCKQSTTVQLIEPNKIVFDELNIKNIACRALKTGEIKVHAIGSGVVNTDYYLLLPNNIISTTGFFTNLEEGNYTIVARIMGCTDTLKVAISLENCCAEIVVPNAFSPNGDYKNDDFKIYSNKDLELNTFQIFNRWGNEVFKTTNSTVYWNGRYKDEDADIGTYFYILKYTCIPTQKVFYKKGDITLVR
jgi:gliding motility-associated-like protein